MKHELTAELLDQVITVDLPLGAILSLGTTAEKATTAETARRRELSTQRPNIGEKGLHGIYTGIARGYTPAPAAHADADGILEALDGEFEGKWQDAMAWAEKLGGRLPTRKEQALLFANVPELFKEEAYWSCEPFAGDERSAWFQYFTYGYQGNDHKDYELRARAVRRLPIE